MTELIGAFRDLEKARKNGSVERHYSHHPWDIFCDLTNIIHYIKDPWGNLGRQMLYENSSCSPFCFLSVVHLGTVLQLRHSHKSGLASLDC
jgi:hypothetical protein